MASDQPSAYDPYAYHHSAPSYKYTYLYDDPYCFQRRRRPAATTYSHIYDYDDPHHGGRRRPRGSCQAGDSLFPAAWYAAPPEPEPPANPIRIEGLNLGAVDPEPKREREEVARRPPRSAEEAAALRVQAAARGFLARRSVREVRRVEREAAAVGRLVCEKAAALRANARARVAAGEVLMKMLLRLDAVRGARGYRRRVTTRVLALQDAVDALDPNAAPQPEAAAADEVAEESAPAAPAEDLPDAAVNGGENAVDAHAKMEVDGNADGGDTEGPDAEGEWEMVADEPAAAASGSAAAAPACPEALRQEPSGQDITAATGAGASDGVDTSKLMEMVAALCEQNAQQRAVIATLAERVDALERTVQQMKAPCGEPRK
ncbi:unnamed protein product [Urochloa humidicola]